MKMSYLFISMVVALSCRDHSSSVNLQSGTDTTIKSTVPDTIRPLSKTPNSINSAHVYPDAIYEDDIQKAQISKSDSSFFVYNNIRKDYRIFGYEKPDTNSKRLIVFSVFTRDVEHNPYGCMYGAYYSSQSLKNIEIKFISDKGSYVLAGLIVKGKTVRELFFEKNWVEFVD